MTSQAWKLYRLAEDPAEYGEDVAGKFIVVTEDGETEVCGVIRDDSDAPVIAASRELYSALKAVSNWLNGDGTGNDCSLTAELEQQVHSAIAKAEVRI